MLFNYLSRVSFIFEKRHLWSDSLSFYVPTVSRSRVSIDLTRKMVVLLKSVAVQRISVHS